jgi:hypothetical protein
MLVEEWGMFFIAFGARTRTFVLRCQLPQTCPRAGSGDVTTVTLDAPSLYYHSPRNSQSLDTLYSKPLH